MRRVLACVDASPSARAVAETAEALGELLRAAVDIVTVNEAGIVPDTLLQDRGPESIPVRALTGEVVPALLAELSSDEVIVAVVGARAVAAKTEVLGHIARKLLERSAVPLVVVPPTAVVPSKRPSVLVPLDGAVATDRAIVDMVGRLADFGVDLLVVHVLDATTMPRVIDTADDIRVLANEFGLRHIPTARHIELRLGDPAGEILDVIHRIEAEGAGVDAALIGWRQDLSPGRADVVRRLLREAAVPLIMVPIVEEQGS